MRSKQAKGDKKPEACFIASGLLRFLLASHATEAMKQALLFFATRASPSLLRKKRSKQALLRMAVNTSDGKQLHACRRRQAKKV
jgi:hypothetical protein